MENKELQFLRQLRDEYCKLQLNYIELVKEERCKGASTKLLKELRAKDKQKHLITLRELEESRDACKHLSETNHLEKKRSRYLKTQVEELNVRVRNLVARVTRSDKKSVVETKRANELDTKLKTITKEHERLKKKYEKQCELSRNLVAELKRVKARFSQEQALNSGLQRKIESKQTTAPVIDEKDKWISSTYGTWSNVQKANFSRKINVKRKELERLRVTSPEIFKRMLQENVFHWDEEVFASYICRTSNKGAVLFRNLRQKANVNPKATFSMCSNAYMQLISIYDPFAVIRFSMGQLNSKGIPRAVLMQDDMKSSKHSKVMHGMRKVHEFATLGMCSFEDEEPSDKPKNPVLVIRARSKRDPFYGDALCTTKDKCMYLKKNGKCDAGYRKPTVCSILPNKSVMNENTMLRARVVVDWWHAPEANRIVCMFVMANWDKMSQREKNIVKEYAPYIKAEKLDAAWDSKNNTGPHHQLLW